MDYTIMIIAKSIATGGNAMTSQLKSFPTKGLAQRAEEVIRKQADKLSSRVEVIRLYDETLP